MFCYKCGEKINDESVFCNFCGTRVNASTLPEQNNFQFHISSEHYQAEPIQKSLFGKTDKEISMTKNAFYFTICECAFPIFMMLVGLIGGNSSTSIFINTAYPIPSEKLQQLFGYGLLIFVIYAFCQIYGIYRRIKARNFSNMKVFTLIFGVVIEIVGAVALCMILNNLFSNLSSSYYSYANNSIGWGCYVMVIWQAIFGVLTAVFTYFGGVEESKANNK